MSGTSLDGVNAVLVDFKPHPPQLLANHYLAYPPDLKEQLLALHQPSDNELHNASLLNIALAQLYYEAMQIVLKKANINSQEISAVGCHGQTIRHQPASGYTIQLGDAALLAELSGITTISNFRQRDIAAGGQGAPLVPAFHDYMFRHSKVHRVILNIGGIANLTDLKPKQPTMGFDCGPGNILMDAWISSHLEKPYDAEGDWAAQGKAIPELLDKLLQEPFFHRPPPKSTGRDLFSLSWLQRFLLPSYSPQNVQATLLELTTITIVNAINQYCDGVEEIYLCGGGARNKTLVKRLSSKLNTCKLVATDQLGVNAEWVEALAFAWLARQTLKKEPGNLPAVTGAKGKRILGAIYPA